MSSTSTAARTRVVAPLVAILGLVLSACSSGTSTGGTTDSAVTEASSDTAKAALEAAYTGYQGTPPTTPTTAKPGVSVWIVSCGDQIPSCSVPAKAAAEAAEAVGWTSTTCDGKLNPEGWSTCVRQGVSAKADVMIPIGIDCGAVQQPFQEAKDAGVTVIGAGGADCDRTGGEALWATERLELEGTDIQQWWEKSGEVAANYLIGATDGKAKVLALDFTDPLWGPWLTDGFTKTIEACEGCEIVDTLDMTNNDIVSGTGASKFAAAIQKATTANAVYVPVGGWMVGGFSQAVVASGRQQDLVVASGLGDAANMGLVASGAGQDAALGYSTAWGAWGSTDTAIRVLNGEEPVVQGDGFAMVDADNNMPAAGQDFDGGVDFVAAYKKAWGVS